MTPEEVGQWLQAHGGPAGGEGPDAQGRIIQRARDGSYVVQQQGPGGTVTVVDVHEAAPAQASAATDGASPPPTGGSGMNQQQVEQWIAQNGGAGALQYNRSSQRVRNPARVMTNADGSENPNYDPTAPEWIDVSEESWTNTRTGAVLRVSRRPDGSFDVKDNKAADPNKPTTSAQTSADAAPRIEGTPLPGGGFDNSQPIMVWRRPDGTVVDTKPLTREQREQWERDKNGGKTDAEIRAEEQTAEDRKPVATHPGYTQVTTKKGGKTETYYLDPNGKRVDSLPEKPETPKPQQAPDGSYGYWDMQPGRPPKWVPIQGGTPGAKPAEPVQINGVWGVWQPGKDGAAPTFAPIENQPGRVKAPADAPTLDTSSATAAHASYLQMLGYADQKFRSGEWTAEQARDFLAIPNQQAQAVITREKNDLTQANNVRDARLAQNRDLESRRVNSANMASSLFSNARAAAGEPGKLRGDLTPEYMMLGARMNQASGAYDPVPEVDIPAAISIGRTPAPPNAIGVNTSPPFVQPGAAPDAATVEAANQAAQAGFRGAVTPLLPPNQPAPEPAPAPAVAAPAMAAPRPVAPAPAPAPAPVPTTATGVDAASDPQTNFGSPGYNPAIPQTGPVGWSPPTEEAPTVAAVGTYRGPSSMAEREEMMLREGFTPQEIAEARRRFLTRMGAAA